MRKPLILVNLLSGEHRNLRKQLVALNSPASKQLHHIVVTDFGEETTAEEAEAQFAECLQFFLSQEGGDEGGGGGEEGGPPPGCENPDVGESTVMSPGYGTTFDLKVESGHTYLLACFLPDKEGSPPHAAAHDMFKAFTVA